mmetsp:Transcript_17044/g.48959  ORF Transcript_17044/g.48959 Transcript_17044/m.48959 type:complete len:221 (-) Transcript_17044:167-829(-)
MHILQVNELRKVHDEVLLREHLVLVAGRPEHFHSIHTIPSLDVDVTGNAGQYLLGPRDAKARPLKLGRVALNFQNDAHHHGRRSTRHGVAVGIAGTGDVFLLELGSLSVGPFVVQALGLPGIVPLEPLGIGAGAGPFVGFAHEGQADRIGQLGQLPWFAAAVVGGLFQQGKDGIGTSIDAIEGYLDLAHGDAFAESTLLFEHLVKQLQRRCACACPCRYC